MENKNTIYIKQVGNAPIPVTVRVEWLPSGKIRPLSYWTPDNSCYEIKGIYESTRLAILKDRGEGIRFLARAELTDCHEYDNLNNAIHETYLYLADNRFCEKNFIDERYANANKKYIPVTLDIFPNGDYELVSFRVDDNNYTVSRTIAIEYRASSFASGIGLCHRVDACLVDASSKTLPIPPISACRPEALYWEINKWYVVVSEKSN